MNTDSTGNEELPLRYQAVGSRRYPVRSDTTLWRYFDFEKFSWLMEKSSLYHSRLDCLGDPFEGSVTRPYAQKRNAGEIRGRDPTPEIESIMNRVLVVSSFATCWHANDQESPAMWKLYAHEQRGVAVVSTFRKLRAAVDTTKFCQGVLGPVEYFDFDNDDMTLPMGLRGRVGWSKRKVFEHEREVRGLIHLENWGIGATFQFCDSLVMEIAERMPLGINVPVDLSLLISEIVVSPSCADWLHELIQISADRRALGHTVRRSRLSDPPVY